MAHHHTRENSDTSELLVYFVTQDKEVIPLSESWNYLQLRFHSARISSVNELLAETELSSLQGAMITHGLAWTMVQTYVRNVLRAQTWKRIGIEVGM